MKKKAADRSSEDEQESDQEDKNHRSSFAFKASEKAKSPVWVIDSGASNHMTNNKKFFDQLKPCKKKIHLANGKVITCSGIGRGVIMGINEKNEPIKLVVSNVLYASELQGSLLSVNRLAQKDYKVQFGANGCKILQGDKIVVVGKVKTGIYQLKDFREDKIPKFMNNAKKSNSQSRKDQLKEEPINCESRKHIAFSAVVVPRAKRFYPTCKKGKKANKGCKLNSKSFDTN
jgi:hypothetical protein